MIVVIQCAASKRPYAGHLRKADGTPVLFVAKPELAPYVRDLAYARPDDDAGDEQSWRQALLRYNEAPGNNSLGLLPAYELYTRDTYRRLVAHFGMTNVFILSAGWGLIPASFLTPAYDITFSVAADAYKRRNKSERYLDLQMIPADCESEIAFLGGKDYVPLFCSLTTGMRCRRTIFYNSGSPPVAPGFSTHRFLADTRTNWHYECADRLINCSSAQG